MVTFPSLISRQTLQLEKGDKLFKQGDAVERIYLITKGKVKLVRNTIDGTPVVLHVGLAGETIAEASLFSEQYHCSAQADVTSTIESVNKQALLDYYHNNSAEMIKLLAVFSRQVRDLRAVNEIKNIRSAEERILAYIRCNVDKNKVMSLNLPLKELAYNIGLAHETFYRGLKKLEDKGIVYRDKQIIRLL